MVETMRIPKRPLWIYAVLPPVILNVAAVVFLGGYYALREVRPEVVSGVDQDQIQFMMYAVIFVVEWIFALTLLREARSRGRPLTAILSPDGELFAFRWVPALLLFLLFNAAFIVYLPVASLLYGGWPS